MVSTILHGEKYCVSLSDHSKRQMQPFMRPFFAGNRQQAPFRPDNASIEAKTFNLFLNSQDKVLGTNASAVFKADVAPDLFEGADRLKVCLKSFIPSYPTGTNDGIVNVSMAGLANPHSYSSSNQNTHRSLGTFILNEGRPREYPPNVLTSSSNSTITGMPYGNGAYTISVSSWNGQAPVRMRHPSTCLTRTATPGGFVRAA